MPEHSLSPLENGPRFMNLAFRFMGVAQSD